jgi:hypothetical protein
MELNLNILLILIKIILVTNKLSNKKIKSNYKLIYNNKKYKIKLIKMFKNI